LKWECCRFSALFPNNIAVPDTAVVCLDQMKRHSVRISADIPIAIIRHVQGLKVIAEHQFDKIIRNDDIQNIVNLLRKYQQKYNFPYTNAMTFYDSSS
jgi:hypothetical protein